jgi:hypothetical protein
MPVANFLLLALLYVCIMCALAVGVGKMLWAMFGGS